MARTSRARVSGNKPDFSFICVAAGNQPIDQNGCRTITPSPMQNRRFCSAVSCRSPWRYCYTCLSQGLGEQSGFVTNPATGLCLFHTRHGTDAKPHLEDGSSVLPRRRLPAIMPSPDVRRDAPAVKLELKEIRNIVDECFTLLDKGVSDDVSKQ